MDILTIILSTAFFLAMGVTYCLGWEYVKKTMPEHLVHYYLFSAVLRFLLVAAVLLAYIRLSCAQRGEMITFVIMFLGMYVAMMVVTLCLKHK
jgi:hypothetical protein